MKKFLTLSLLLLMTIACDAQVYEKKIVMDKFDDIVSEKTIKTLIEKNDTAIIIEEKGSKPVQYRILSYDEEGAKGSKDNIVNIFGNLYGYEECWCVILEKDVPRYNLAHYNARKEQDYDKRLNNMQKLGDEYWYFITHRVIVTQYTNTKVADYIFVQKGEKNGRTVYSYHY